MKSDLVLESFHITFLKDIKKDQQNPKCLWESCPANCKFQANIFISNYLLLVYPSFKIAWFLSDSEQLTDKRKIQIKGKYR